MPENSTVLYLGSKFVFINKHLQKEQEPSGPKTDKQKDAGKAGKKIGNKTGDNTHGGNHGTNGK